VIVLTGVASWPSARAATRTSAATAATCRRGRRRRFTSPTCRCRCGGCRSRSSRWSPATRSRRPRPHVCCDLTIAADKCPLRPDRAAGRLLGRRLRRLAAARSGGPNKRRSSGCSAASTTPSRRLQMGLVNTVVPRRSWKPRRPVVPRDAGALALRRCARSSPASTPTRRLRRHPAARPRRQPPVLRSEEAQEGASL